MTDATLQPARVLPPKDPGVALILELVPGMFLQTFGIGNLYVGNLGAGIAILIGYWIASLVNFLLCFVLIGFVTWPLTWIGFAIFSSWLAVERARTREALWLAGR